MNTPSANDEVHTTAQRWFARLLAPDCSAVERAEFERWRAANPLHAAAYENVEDVWQRSEKLRHQPDIAAALREARRPAPRRTERSWWPAMAVAASLLLAVGLLFRHQLFPEKVLTVRYATALGEQRTLTLEDGSTVVLDTASKLLVQFSSRERSLTLQQGRADFQVHADAQRPFVVHAANGTVTATGTQFQVRVEQGIGRVTLLEGQVQVAAAAGGNGRPATLAPGERIAIEAGRLGQRERIADTEMASIRGWTQGNLVVKEWPLQAVVAEMNRYSDTKLRLGESDLGRIPISGVFKAGDQQSFAMSLEYGWPIRADRTAGEIVLHRK